MMNSDPYAPHPLSWKSLKASFKELRRLWTHDSSLRTERSLWEALQVLWSNLTSARTHAYYTGTPAGVWGDAQSRLETAMTTALVRFIEGDWYNMQRALSEEDLPEEPSPELLIEMLEEDYQWRKEDDSANAEPVGKALEAYRYLKKERPQISRLVGELDDRTELTMEEESPDGERKRLRLESSNDVWSRRRMDLEMHRTERDQEILALIGEIVHWMWV